MFKLFDIFKRTKDTPKNEETDLKEVFVESLDKELKDKIDEELETLNLSAKEVLSKIKKVFSEINSLSKEIRGLELPEMDTRLKSRVESALDILTQKISISYGKLKSEREEFKSYEEFLESKSKIGMIIEDVVKTDSVHSRLVAICFNKQIIRLTDQLKALLISFNELEKLVEEKGKSIEDLKSLLSSFNEIPPKERFIGGEEKKAMNREKEFEFVSKSLLMKKKRVDNLLESEVFIQGQIELNLLKKNQEDLDFNLRNNFAGFKKTLNKFRHDFGSEFSKETQNIIDAYCRDVVEGVSVDKDLKIEGVLQKMIEQVNKDGLSMPSKQKEKILNENLSIVRHLQSFLTAKKEISSNENKFSDFEEVKKEVSRLKGEIKRQEREKELKSRELEAVRKIISSKKEELNEQKSKLFSSLKEFGIKIKE